MKKFTTLIPKKWIIVICMNIMIVQFSTVLAQTATLELTRVTEMSDEGIPQDGNAFNSGPFKILSGAGANPEVNTNEADPASDFIDRGIPQDGNAFNSGPFKILSGAGANPEVKTNEADQASDFIDRGIPQDGNAFNSGPFKILSGAGANSEVNSNEADMLIYRPGATKPSNANTTGERTPSSSNDNSNSNVTSNSPSPAPTTNTPNPNASETIPKASGVTDGAPKSTIVNADGTTPGPYCEKGAKYGKKPRGDDLYMSNDVPFPGSAGLNQCERLSFGHMKNLYKGGRRTGAIEDWKDFLDFACKDSCNNPTEYNECISKKMKSAKTCESIAYLISVNGRDWNSPSDIKADPKGTPSVTTGITCTSAGVETLDYEPCKKFATNIDTVEAVQQIGYGTQQMIYQDKMIDAQSKYVNEANAATGALKGQKDSIEMQQEMYQQRTAVDAAKLALLYSAYQAMTSSENLVSQCNTMPGVEISPGHSVSKVDCTNAARAGQSNFALLLNEKETEKMKTKMIAVATQAGSSAMLASLLGKRAKDIGKALAKIDAFVPLDPLAPVQDDLTSTFCKQNPALPECLTAGLEKTYDPLADNIITFGEGGQGTNYGTNNTNSDGSSSGGISDSPTSRESVGSVGTVVSAAAQDDSIEASTAATVSSGGTGSSGGGGGGSGGGVGGGGGGGPIGSGSPGGTQAAVQGKTPTYAGGAGSLSMMGGFGIKPKAANGKEENPFGKLFGKEGAKTSVVNFRDIASQKVGDKGDNLFDMISKRYTTVNADKRLIEYELAK
jgi:hypothetical protein